MNHLRALILLAALLLCILSAPGVWAQPVETKVDRAEVVYVEGNDVVLKLTNGEVKQFEVSDSDKFTVDNKDVTVRELKPGMTLTATITTAAAPRWVDAVEVVEVGTVWKTVGNNLIIRTPEGKNKMYRVPVGGTVTLEGKTIAVGQLREGDKITATIVKTRSPSEVGTASSRPLQTPSMPPRVGALLIDEGAKPGEGTKPDEPSSMWGGTGIIILIVAILLVAGLILLAFWRKRKAKA